MVLHLNLAMLKSCFHDQAAQGRGGNQSSGRRSAQNRSRYGLPTGENHPPCHFILKSDFDDLFLGMDANPNQTKIKLATKSHNYIPTSKRV